MRLYLSGMANTQNLKSAFLHSVKRGTGRAYLLARANPDVDFSDCIIRAALKNFAYDGQAEPSRAQYLHGLYCLSAQRARIQRAVLQGLAKEQDDTWTLTQLFHLALLFSQQGDEKARLAIYDRFLTNPIQGSDWVGSDEIITLDGLEGLKFIARKFGKVLAKTPDDWQDDSIIRSFQKAYPTMDAWAELGLLAEQDEDVRRYLRNVEATLARQRAHKQSAEVDTGLAEILQAKHTGYIGFRLRKRGLEPTEAHKLAEQLLTEKSRTAREKLLFVFTLFPFPGHYEPILALATQKPKQGDRIVEFAIGALQHLRAPEIRAFALQRLQRTTSPAQYTDIMLSNYQEGDAALLTDLVTHFRNEHTIEMLAVSYVAIYQFNKTKECAAPLLALYQKTTCGIHRRLIVELLIENSVLPDWLNEELPFDSCAETRLLHRPKF